MMAILVPLDGSTFAEHALDYAMPLAVRSKAEIHLLFVSSLSVLNPPLGARSGPWLGTFRAHQEDYLQGVAAQHEREGGPSIRTALQDGDPSHEIAEYARNHNCDLIVMTSHGRGGLERVWLGSVTTAVLGEAQVPVLVVRAGAGSGAIRPDEAWAPRTIVAAVDETEVAEHALRRGADLAELFEAELVIVEVVPPPTGPASPYLPHAAAMLHEGHKRARRDPPRTIDSRRAVRGGHAFERSARHPRRRG